MRNEIDELIEEAKKEEKYFKNYKKYAKIIKKEAEKILGKVKVFVFGSILKEDEVAKDIDILIVSPKLKNSSEKSKVKAQLWKKLKLFYPFEVHLLNPEEYKNWYSRFIEEKIEI